MPITPWTSSPFVDGLWTQERIEDGVSVLRSVALALTDETLLVVSPMRDGPAEAFDRLLSLGRPSVVLAPNHFHNMGLARYAERFDPCSIVASETALPRLERRMGRKVDSLDLLRARLPSHVRLLEPPGTRTGEVWLRLETDRGIAWIVGDAFFNVTRPPRTPAGLLFLLLGVTSGLRVGPTFRWIALADAGAYARWLATQIDTDDPAILVPAHGEIDAGPDLARRLRGAAVRRRLLR